MFLWLEISLKMLCESCLSNTFLSHVKAFGKEKEICWLSCM